MSKRILFGMIGLGLALSACGHKNYNFIPDESRKGADPYDIECGTVEWETSNGWRTNYEQVGRVCRVDE